jgi:hypothetical protein
MGLRRNPLGLVRILKELLEWKSSGSGLETTEFVVAYTTVLG